jgi:hypothetical protein
MIYGVSQEDIEELVARIDRRLAAVAETSGFLPYEGPEHVGEFGYITEKQFDDAFAYEPKWAKPAYWLYREAHALVGKE